MIVVYCDICDGMIGKENEAEPFHVKLWKEKDIYGFNDICPACAGSIKALIENYRKKAKP